MQNGQRKKTSSRGNSHAAGKEKWSRGQGFGKAKIKDERFAAAVDANQPFAKGDVFVVNLSIVQEFDTSVNDFLNKSFEVTNVLKHIAAPVQISLFGKTELV